ncbi:MAG: 2TM domain-containing protein [Bacteroidetes bacterium]|nr:2TM domain-containing protein [Bacteroidota bacterium]
MENLTEKDQLLWKIAKKRVSFRRHLFVYLIINAFVWAVWILQWIHHGPEMDGMASVDVNGHMHRWMFPWPIFMTLGWGIGVAFDYYNSYVSNKWDAIEKEFEKLKNKN